MRLGWSRHDLIRWMGCTSEEFESWAKAKRVPQTFYNSKLATLVNECESYSMRLTLAPLADHTLEEQNLSQIDETTLTSIKIAA